jgi:hypothetical protein
VLAVATIGEPLQVSVCTPELTELRLLIFFPPLTIPFFVLARFSASAADLLAPISMRSPLFPKHTVFHLALGRDGNVIGNIMSVRNQDLKRQSRLRTSPPRTRLQAAGSGYTTYTYCTP